MQTLKERLAPGGRLVFAGEPIMDDESRPWVGPWGVRLDGISLSAMRAYRCLELGFTESYFVRLLIRNGFVVSHHICQETAIGNSWVATLADTVLHPNHVVLAPDESATWGPGDPDPAGTWRFTLGASRITLDEDERWRGARVRFTNRSAQTLSAEVSAGEAVQSVSVEQSAQTTVSVVLPNGRRVLAVGSHLAPVKGVSEPVGLAVDSIELFE